MTNAPLDNWAYQWEKLRAASRSLMPAFAKDVQGAVFLAAHESWLALRHLQPLQDPDLERHRRLLVDLFSQKGRFDGQKAAPLTDAEISQVSDAVHELAEWFTIKYHKHR